MLNWRLLLACVLTRELLAELLLIRRVCQCWPPLYVNAPQLVLEPSGLAGKVLTGTCFIHNVCTLGTRFSSVPLRARSMAFSTVDDKEHMCVRLQLYTRLSLKC